MSRFSDLASDIFTSFFCHRPLSPFADCGYRVGGGVGVRVKPSWSDIDRAIHMATIYRSNEGRGPHLAEKISENEAFVSLRLVADIHHARIINLPKWFFYSLRCGWKPAVPLPEIYFGKESGMDW